MKFVIPKMLLCVASIVGSQILVSGAYVQDGGHDSAKSQAGQSTSDVNKTKDGIAVKGYDVVSYFDQKKPMKGTPKYSYEYQGARYEFVSAEHLAAFTKSPESYRPQYGGYCAVGTSMGHKADIDP